MAMVWLWAGVKEQIEAFADSSWSYAQPRHHPTRSLTQTTGALAVVHFSMRDAKCAVTRALWKVQPRAVDAEHAICVDLCLGRGVFLLAGRLYHTSDDGIIKPLSMRQLLQHWQQAQLHGHRTISRSCVASFLRKWKRYEQREWLIIEIYWARQRPLCRKWRFSRPLNEAPAFGCDINVPLFRGCFKTPLEHTPKPLPTG